MAKSSDPDIHQMFGQILARLETVRMEAHDGISGAHDRIDNLPKPKELPQGDEIQTLLSVAGLIDARIQAGEQQATKALEPLKAAIEKDSANDEATAKALTDLCAKTEANTAAITALTAAFKELTKTLGKKKTRTGVVNTPEGPISMTVTEH